MNYWYVARPNELFLDIDNVSKSIRHARARLQGAIECGKLDVSHVMQRQSKSKDHLHAIIKLRHDMTSFRRFIWEIILHGDIYRGCCNIARELENCITEDGRETIATDVLISPYANFENVYNFGKRGIRIQRLCDDQCNCPAKHTAAVMLACPAAKRLRGEMRAVGFFGKPSKNPCTIWPDP